MGITHVAVMDSQESTELSTKLSIAKHLWLKRSKDIKTPSRGLLFVPSSADAAQALGILRFWGLSEATNLLTLLGLESNSNPNADGEENEMDIPPRPLAAMKRSLPQPHRSTADLVRRARLSGLGSSLEGLFLTL